MCTMEEIEERVKRLQRNKEQISEKDMPKYEKALNAFSDGIVKDICKNIRENVQKDDASEYANLAFLIVLNLTADDLIPGVKECNMDSIWTACLDASRFYPIIRDTLEEWDLETRAREELGKEA